MALFPANPLDPSEPDSAELIASALGPGGGLALLESRGLDDDPSDGGPALVRLDADGTPDPSFGDGGVAPIRQEGTFAGLDLGAGRIAVQADGSIVTSDSYSRPSASGIPAGEHGDGANIWRSQADGSVDESFDRSEDLRRTTVGVIQDGCPGDTVGGLAFQPDGSILQDGSGKSASGPDGRAILANRVGSSVAIRRIGLDGRVDGSFGAGGQVVIGLGGAIYPDGAVTELAVQPDGKILVGLAGLLVERFDADGAPDLGFDAGGSLRVPGYFPPARWGLTRSTAWWSGPTAGSMC